MSGFLRPAAAKMSTTSSETTALRDDLPDGVVELLVGLALAGRALGEHRAHRLEEADVVADAQRLVVRHRQRERLRQLGDGAQQPRLAVLLRQDVLLRRRQQRQPLLRRARRSSGDQSKPWKRPRQTSYFSSISATASAWSSAVSPVPPLSV